KSANKNWLGLSVTYTGGGTSTILGVGTFKNITVTGDATYAGQDRFQLNTNITVLGSLTITGGGAAKRMLMFANSGTRNVIMSATVSVNVSYTDIQSIHFSTARDLSGSTGGTVDLGGNNNIT